VIFREIPNAALVQDKILQTHQNYLKNLK